MSYNKEKLEEILNKAHQDIENARRNDGIAKGKPSLEFNPPGYRSPQRKHFATQEEIDNRVADIKADAMKQADNLFGNLSAEEKKAARDSVQNNLYPEDPKPGTGKQEKGVNQSQEYMNSQLSQHSRADESAQRSGSKTWEQPIPSEPKQQEPSPEVPPEGKGQSQQASRYERSLSSFKASQEEITQDKDLRRNFNKNGKDISEAKKEEEKKDDKGQEIEKEQPDTKDQPVMEEQQPEMKGNEDVGRDERYLSALSSERENQEMDAQKMSKEEIHHKNIDATELDRE